MPGFPVVLQLGRLSISAHFVCELLAYALAFRVYLARRRRFGDMLESGARWLVIAAAAAGAALGSKILSWLADPAELAARWNDPAWLLQQKTLVGGILGGWLAVELVKQRAGIAARTGDLFAVPLCLGIAIGRVGCFLAGLGDRTYGSESHLPWAVDFGDGVARHPVQLYESVFALLLAVVLHILETRPHARGAVFRTFLVGYLGFRLLLDFLKPAPAFLGLGTLQWAALAAVVFVLLGARRQARLPRARTA